MKIDTEKFLAMTALLAGTALGVACSSDSKDGEKNGGASDSGAGGSDDGDSGGGGKANGGKGGGAATGGKGGGAATGGKGGGGTTGGGGGGTTGGGGTDGGGGGTDGGDGGDGDGGPSECLGDVAPATDAGTPDAGAESIPPCVALPTTLTDCGDAGVEGVDAPALAVCWSAEANLRAGVFASVLECLKAGTPPAEPCSEEAMTRATGCYDAAVANACDHTADAGTNPCAAFTAACPATTEKTCNDVFKAFSEESTSYLADCLTASMAAPDAGGEGLARCGFWQCVGLVR